MSPIPPNIVTTFRKNLDALGTVDAELAGRLGAVDWPGGLKFMPAIDGTPSAWGPGLSRSGWFAFSGSPRVREQVLCEYFNAGESNVLLPGAGQGYGLGVLLAKYERWQSVFVWEPKVLNLAILLGLRDFSEAISDRRLVFLTQDDLEKSLVDYFTANQEMTIPTKMLAWPWIEESQLSLLPQAIERAIGKLNPMINQTIGALRTQLEVSLRKIEGRSRREVQVFGLISNRQVNRLVRDIAGGVKKIGCRSEAFLVDRPGHYGVVEMLRQMIHRQPDTIVSVGVNKKNWSIGVPSNIDFISVLSMPGAMLGAKYLEDLSAPEAGERYVLGDRGECDELRKRVGSDHIYAIEAAVNPEAFYPIEETHEYDVVVVANYNDIEPKTWGVTQESHKKLWQQISRTVEEDPLRVDEEQIPALIERASRACGVRLEEAKLRESLENLVRTVLAPSCASAAIARTLIEAGLRIRLVGSGWDKAEAFSVIAQEPPESPEELNELLHRGDGVLYLDTVTNRRQVVFDSLCAGRVVMVRRLPTDGLASLPEIAKRVVYLEARGGLVKQVRTTLDNLPTLRERMKHERDELAGKYSIDKQMKDIFR